MRLLFRLAVGATLFASGRLVCLADDAIEQAPIEYSKAEPRNRISRLQAKLDSGELKLSYDGERGYLPALLDALRVPVESQMLVFSKTSLQRARISPRSPRAVYFNDDVYVGYCRKGEVLEITAADPQLGAVFYTLAQQETPAPRFARQTESCLICHSSSRTEGVPGLLVRSVFTDGSGEPVLSMGSTTVDYRTPLADRWGGWYVTGLHGKQQHRGNLIVEDGARPEPIDNANGQNVTALADRFKVAHYPAAHSDIVALMVLEHQAVVHNRLTKANFETRAALHYERELNRALGEPEGNRLDSTTRRIENAGNQLVDALLLVDEAPLAEPIAGTSGFAEAFEQGGPKDPQGRSLRQFDLKSRLFRYPCSYLIYSEAFDGLPPEMRQYVWQRLGEVLRGDDRSGRFDHLTLQDRRDIAAIVRDTKSGLPENWP